MTSKDDTSKSDSKTDDKADNKAGSAKPDAAQSGAPDAGGKSASAGATPPPTIELTAKEVPEKKAAPDKKAGAAPTKDKPKAASATPPPPSSPPPSSGGGRGWASGFIGGVVGAAIVAGASLTGLMPGTKSDDSAQLAITSLETQVLALESEVAAAQAQIAALGADIDSAGGAPAALAPLESALEDLRAQMPDGSRIDALEADIAALRAAPAPQSAGDGGANADLAGEIDTLGTTLSSLSESVASLRADLDETRAIALTLPADGTESGEASPGAITQPAVNLASVLDRLAAAEAQLEQAASVTPAADDTVVEELAALGAELETLSAESESRTALITELQTALSGGFADAAGARDAMAESTSAEIASVADQLGGLVSRVDGVEANAAALSDRVTGLSDALGALEARDTGAERERQAAMLIALSGLHRAASGAGPFEAELDTVIGLLDTAGDTANLEALRPYAASGAPTLERLAADFTALAGTLIDASASGEGGTVMERLAANAQTLIRVRPTGYVEGESAGARVARIEALLHEGKLKAALEQWDTLGDGAKAASAEWADAARARLAVEAAVSAAGA